jgi:hypothetical protein
MVKAASEIHSRLGQGLLDDVIGLDIARWRLFRIDAEILQFMRRSAPPDAPFEAAAAEVVEHTDLFREPQRMMHRQHIDERPQPNALRPLRDRREKHAGRGRHAEGRRMMLAHVIGAKAGTVVELDQSQAILILISEGKRPEIVLVENSELHESP